MIIISLVLTVLLAIAVVLVLVIQDRKASAFMAELEAGGGRRDAALSSLPPKSIRTKVREAGGATQVAGMPLRVTLEKRPEKKSEERESFDPFSDSLRASRLN